MARNHISDKKLWTEEKEDSKKLTRKSALGIKAISYIT